MAKGRKNQAALVSQELARLFFRNAFAAGVVTLQPHMEYETKWTLTAADTNDPNTTAPDPARVVHCEEKGLTVVCLTPYWPAATHATTGTLWLFQADEPDTAKRWRPVLGLTFDAPMYLRQLFLTGGHDLFFRCEGGPDSGNPTEIHVDAA